MFEIRAIKGKRFVYAINGENFWLCGKEDRPGYWMSKRGMVWYPATQEEMQAWKV